MNDLNRVLASLTAMGLDSLVHELSAGPLLQIREFNFGSLRSAESAQRLLYRFMWFHPEIKSRTTLRLNKLTGMLSIIPKSRTEKRGRKKIF